jgi:hypothetical protein
MQVQEVHLLVTGSVEAQEHHAKEPSEGTQHLPSADWNTHHKSCDGHDKGGGRHKEQRVGYAGVIEAPDPSAEVCR